MLLTAERCAGCDLCDCCGHTKAIEVALALAELGKNRAVSRPASLVSLAKPGSHRARSAPSRLSEACAPKLDSSLACGQPASETGPKNAAAAHPG